MSSPIWQIDTLSVSNTGGLVDVVVTAFWRVNASDGEHTGTAYGGVSLDAPTPGAFADFDALTEAQVLGWVKAKLDVAATEAAALANLEAARNPPTRYKQPGWRKANGKANANGKDKP